MDRIAAIVITDGRRKEQVCERVLPSVLAQDFDDVLVVGKHEVGAGFHYLHVAAMTATTTDALVKRDVGTLATTCPILLYLCDDHILAPGFGAALRSVLDEPWDVIVPNRNTNILRSGGLPGDATYVSLNNGEREGYCGGHAGIFRRHVITAKPWSAHAHHRNWDALISHEQIARGARFVWSPRDELTVTDIEPQAQPWL